MRPTISNRFGDVDQKPLDDRTKIDAAIAEFRRAIDTVGDPMLSIDRVDAFVNELLCSTDRKGKVTVTVPKHLKGDIVRFIQAAHMFNDRSGLHPRSFQFSSTEKMKKRAKFARFCIAVTQMAQVPDAWWQELTFEDVYDPPNPAISDKRREAASRKRRASNCAGYDLSPSPCASDPASDGSLAPPPAELSSDSDHSSADLVLPRRRPLASLEPPCKMRPPALLEEPLGELLPCAWSDTREDFVPNHEQAVGMWANGAYRPIGISELRAGAHAVVVEKDASGAWAPAATYGKWSDGSPVLVYLDIDAARGAIKWQYAD